MAQVWVSSVDGSTLVRADAITSIKTFSPGEGEARVSVTADGESVLVRIREGISQPGDSYDHEAVADIGRVMIKELAEAIARLELQTTSYSYTVHYPLEAHARA